jgi:hypothetical protein
MHLQGTDHPMVRQCMRIAVLWPLRAAHQKFLKKYLQSWIIQKVRTALLVIHVGIIHSSDSWGIACLFWI